MVFRVCLIIWVGVLADLVWLLLLVFGLFYGMWAEWLWMGMVFI